MPTLGTPPFHDTTAVAQDECVVTGHQNQTTCGPTFSIKKTSTWYIITASLHVHPTKQVLMLSLPHFNLFIPLHTASRVGVRLESAPPRYCRPPSLEGMTKARRAENETRHAGIFSHHYWSCTKKKRQTISSISMPKDRAPHKNEAGKNVAAFDCTRQNTARPSGHLRWAEPTEPPSVHATTPHPFCGSSQGLTENLQKFANTARQDERQSIATKM